MLTVGSLFSGIGGLDLGLERAGMVVRWQVEIDPACIRVLERHWPKVRRYGDIREINPAELEPVDLLCGGFPCQDVSVAGKRAGLAGRQSSLYWEFHRIASGLAPRWLVIENVPGLLSSQKGRDFWTILDSLVELGYGVAWRILDAQYFGLAQRRKRVFVVGHLGEPWSAPAKVLFEPESLPWYPPPRRKAGKAVASLLASGAGTNRPAGIASEVDFLGAEVAPTLTWGGTGARGWKVSAEQAADGALVAHPITTRADQRQEPTSDTYVIQDVRGHMEKRQHGIGIDDADVCYTLDATSRHGIAHVFPTLRGFGHGRQGQHWDDAVRAMMVRRLTPLEYERLQGFPDGWTAGESDTARYRMLGNAVAVPVAEWIGRRIIQVHEWLWGR